MSVVRPASKHTTTTCVDYAAHEVSGALPRTATKPAVQAPSKSAIQEASLAESARISIHAVCFVSLTEGESPGV